MSGAMLGSLNGAGPISEPPAWHSPSQTVKRLRVLAIAYACEPERGSEPGLGWTLASCLAADHQVIVVTEAQHRTAILKYLKRKRDANLRFLFIEVPFWKPTGITRRPNPRWLDLAYYCLWEVLATTAAWRLCNREKIDVVHHITFANVMLPPLVALLPCKFIWGPIGPVEGIPWAFLKTERATTVVRDLLRRAALWAFLHVSPIGLVARVRASALLFKTTSAKSMVGGRFLRYDAVLYDAPDRPSTFVAKRADEAARPLRVVTISRLEPQKGITYAISGFVRFLHKGGQGKLTILGEGPERRRLLEQITRLGAQASIELIGYVPQSRVFDELGRADVLLHPAFREGFASACLEALGSGVPVVCQQRSGLLDMIDESCGILAKADKPEALNEDIGEALMMLYRHPQLRARLRAGALKRRQDLSTSHAADTLRSVYRQLTEDETD